MITTKSAAEPKRVIVTRAFVYDGAVVQAGAVVTLLPAFASEMLAANKVEAAPDAAPDDGTAEMVNKPGKPGKAKP